VTAAWRGAATERWNALGERERLLLLVGSAILGAALLWWLGLAPALRTVRSAPAQIEALDAQLQQMQTLAAEVRELRATPALPSAQAQAALNAAAQRLGDKLRLSLQGERAVIDLNGLPGEALASWLAEVRLNARARVVEAQLVRTPQGGYRGKVVLVLGGRT
jgi:general secretion pathway protein M